MVDVLMPYPEADAVAAGSISVRVPDLTGRVVGIINNSWHCMDLVTDELRSALQSNYSVAEVVEVKISATQTLPEDDLARLSETCDAAIVGIGTCGSCSRWVLQDAIGLERRGVPTVAVFTKVFEQLARAVRSHEGMPDLELAILPHPLNSLPDEQIREIAADAVGAIVGSLTKATVPA